MKATDAFRDAEALADFANLNPADSDAVAYFRNNHPDFAPSEWWDYRCRIGGSRVIRAEDINKIRNDPDYKTKLERLGEGLLQWQDAQDAIQKVWKVNFKLNASGISDLLKLVFYVDRPGLVWNSSQVLLPNGTICELNTRLYDFHKAVLYLHQHPRQAKICKNRQCRKHFVTARGKRDYCLFPDEKGDTCSQRKIAEDHMDWWIKVGDKRRKAKLKAELKAKLKAKRKNSKHRGAHNA